MKKKKILIIDDEQNFTKTVKLNLEETGKYEVETKNNGVRCVPFVKRIRPDLILLDVLMPDIGGADVAAQLKEDEGVKDIPIVFITAAVTKDEAGSKFSLIGGRAYLSKPVSTEDLIACIEENT